MPMIDDLMAAGIHLNSYASGNHATICPRCSHTRKAANQKKPCLSVTIENGETAVWLCHNCAWPGAAGKVHKRPSHNPSEVKAKAYVKPEIAKEAYTTTFPKKILDYFESRKIALEVVQKNRLIFEPDSGAICFPFFEAKDKTDLKPAPVNIKHKPYMRESKIRFWLEKGAKIPFYGLDAHFYEAWEQSKEIIIVEGEFDKLAFNAAGLWNVLSVPHGAPQKELGEKTDKFDFLIHAEPLLKETKRFVIATDNDPAGKILEKELCRRLGVEKCWLVTMPLKDANDVLKELGADVLCEVYQEAKAHPINGLFTVDAFQQSLVDFYKQDMQSGAKTGWENVDGYYTVMPGRLTVVTGVPYSGKSEWIDALTVNLAKNDSQKFAIFSPEHSKEEHVTKLIEKVTERSAAPGNKDRMPLEDFNEAAAWVCSNYFFIVSDDMNDLPTIDWILDKAKSAVLRYGITGLIIDPYNEIEHRRPGGMTESEYISQLLSKIKRFAKAYKIHIWIVAHPAKQTKDANGNIQVPGGYDISGSANWLNKADNLIVVHRADQTHVTQIHIKKVKPKYAGKQGMCHLTYNRDTGIYSSVDNETEFESGKKKGPKTGIEDRYFNTGDDTLETYR